MFKKITDRTSRVSKKVKTKKVQTQKKVENFTPNSSNIKTIPEQIERMEKA